MKIQSPLVYLRFDAIMLLLVWVLALNERLIPDSSSLIQVFIFCNLFIFLLLLL